MGGSDVRVRELREESYVVRVEEYGRFECVGIGNLYLSGLKKVGESTDPCGTPLGSSTRDGFHINAKTSSSSNYDKETDQTSELRSHYKLRSYHFALDVSLS